MEASLYRCFLGLIFSLFCLPHVSFAFGAPNITSQPTNQVVALGSTAVFHVTAGGKPPLCYQWHFNGTNLLGGTNISLTLTNVQLTNAGIYSVTVTNIYPVAGTNRSGSATSSNAVLTVLMPPSITTQPANQAIWAGSNATFSAVASGTAPLNYQWNFNGTNLSGATNSSLTLTNVQLNQAGNTRCW